jgi:hypothetical protein
MTTPLAPNPESVQAALEALVAAGQRQFEHWFAHTDQAFDDPVWNVGHRQKRFTNSENLRLFFTHYGTTDRPLPESYARVVKCWLLLSDWSVSAIAEYGDATRCLWPTLERRYGAAAVPFAWQTLCEEDLRQAELWMQARFAGATVYRRMGALLLLARFLEMRHICRPLFYAIQTACPSKAVYTVAAQEARLNKLPSPRALAGLADVYHHLAQTPQDRLRAAAIAVLVVTGFRVSELLTLPVDCEVEETRQGRPAYGLRYYKTKARLPEKMVDVRWLTPLQSQLARRAIGEIRALTAEARQQARILEENDPHIPIPGFDVQGYMKTGDIQRLLGMPRSDQVHNSIARARLPRYGRPKAYYFRVSEFEAYLCSRRVKHLWTVNKGNGSYQMLSESLFGIFQNFFFPRGGHVCLLVEPLRKGHINSFLSSHGLNKSVFERFDIREEDSSVCRLSSHQFRHWLNDLADKGGLPMDVLTRWMGRENPRHTDAYRHATMEERLHWVKDGIPAQQFAGTMANVYFELPEAERDLFLASQIQAVHFTPMGLCVHDFAVEPCPYHLNCVRGCPDYLRTKGNPRERGYLQAIQAQTEQALADARQKVAETQGTVAQSWVTHHEKTLQGIRLALAVDDEEAIPQGQRVRPATVPIQRDHPTERNLHHGTQA